MLSTNEDSMLNNSNYVPQQVPRELAGAAAPPNHAHDAVAGLPYPRALRTLLPEDRDNILQFIKFSRNSLREMLWAERRYLATLLVRYCYNSILYDSTRIPVKIRASFCCYSKDAWKTRASSQRMDSLMVPCLRTVLIEAETPLPDNIVYTLTKACECCGNLGLRDMWRGTKTFCSRECADREGANKRARRQEMQMGSRRSYDYRGDLSDVSDDDDDDNDAVERARQPPLASVVEQLLDLPRPAENNDVQSASENNNFVDADEQQNYDALQRSAGLTGLGDLMKQIEAQLQSQIASTAQQLDSLPFDSPDQVFEDSRLYSLPHSPATETAIKQETDQFLARIWQLSSPFEPRAREDSIDERIDRNDISDGEYSMWYDDGFATPPAADYADNTLHAETSFAHAIITGSPAAASDRNERMHFSNTAPAAATNQSDSTHANVTVSRLPMIWDKIDIKSEAVKIRSNLLYGPAQQLQQQQPRGLERSSRISPPPAKTMRGQNPRQVDSSAAAYREAARMQTSTVADRSDYSYDERGRKNLHQISNSNRRERNAQRRGAAAPGYSASSLRGHNNCSDALPQQDYRRGAEEQQHYSRSNDTNRSRSRSIRESSGLPTFHQRY